jgi:thiamine kinase-like enzyme
MISLDEIKPFAYGRRSGIFQIDNDHILKLYDENFSKELIKREFEVTIAVNKIIGDITAKPFSIEKHNNRTGIVFEKIDGESFMDLFQKNPILYFTKGQTLADIHKQILSKKISGIPTQVDEFKALINESPRINDKEKNQLLTILTKPNANMLCHGDFHHGNVINTKSNKFVVLDWMDAFIGDPLLDIALTAVNAAVSDAPSHVPKIYKFTYEWLKKIVKLDKRILNYYPEFNKKNIKEAVILAAGIHLARKVGNVDSHRRYFDKSIQYLK